MSVELLDHFRSFGAKGDGTTDDAAAFNAAVVSANKAGGGTIYIPSGTYKLGSTVELLPGVTLRGSGKATKLLHYCGANPVLRRTSTVGGDSYISGIRVCDLQIVGQATSSGDAIQLNGTSPDKYITDVVIERVQFTSLYGADSNAIFANFALETRIVGCRVYQCRGNGFVLQGASNASVIRDCNLSNGGYGAGWAIKIPTPTDGCLIEGCVIEGWRGLGGIVVNGSSNLIARNWLEDNNGVQISIGLDTDTAYKAYNVLIGNNDSPGAGTVASLDTPNGDGTRGVLDLTLIGNQFVSEVRLKSGGGGNPANYFILGGFQNSIVDTTTPGFDRVWKQSRSVSAPVVSGSRGGNVALANLLTELAGIGYIKDNSTT